MPSAIHDPVIVHDSEAMTAAPLADLQGPLAYWGPPPPARRQPATGDGDPAAVATAVQAWVHHLRTEEAAYAQHAAVTGAPVTPLTEDERWFAAQLAVALGLPPATAARLRALHGSA